MNVLTHEIKVPAMHTKIEHIVLEPSVETSIDISTDAYATARILIESVGDSVGPLHITTHADSGSRIFVGVCVRSAGSDSFAIKSVQRHEAPHGTSRIWVHKIVSDGAVATYQGLIHIAEDAVGTVVSQDDKTLLDGLKARAESQPILEVLNNDVSCSHGSALGRVDPQMVWYMQSRGFDADAAHALLYEAFFDEVRKKVLSA